MEPKIVVEISPDGEVKIEALGFSGCGCTEATRAIEQALGGTKQREYKPEFYAASDQQQEQDLSAQW